MRSIDFTPGQDVRRQRAEHIIRAAMLAYLDTPEHRMVVLGGMVDEAIGEAADHAAISALLKTLVDTYRARMAQFAGPGGSA